MGGKGRRRREKNYRAAHGAGARLPPPPKLKELEAMPSKLRRLIKLKNAPPGRELYAGSEKRGREVALQEKNKMNQKYVHTSADKVEMGDSNGKTTIKKNVMEKDEIADSSIDGVQKGKRKRQAVTDLRFQDLDQSTSQSRKKKRKEYLDAKRKKSKKQKTEDIPEFPGHEEIKFGEIVDAPPKLSFPKVTKSPLDASLERHRLQAIENYRNQRGWSSRPGIKLPSLAEDLAL